MVVYRCYKIIALGNIIFILKSRCLVGRYLFLTTEYPCLVKCQLLLCTILETYNHAVQSTFDTSIMYNHAVCTLHMIYILTHTDTEKQEIRRNGESHNDIHTTVRRAENVAVLPISTQNYPQPFYHQYHPQQHGVSPNYTSSQHTGHYTRHSTDELLQQHPSQTQSYSSVPYSRNDYVTANGVKSSYHQLSNYTQDPRAINYSNKMSSERLNIADGLSDHKVPANSPILWELSQEVKEWKFVARNLDLEERVIEEIDQYTIPNRMRDKSLRVFTEWVNSALRPTWKALGEALCEAEYILLYEKLLELVKSHTI